MDYKDINKASDRLNMAYEIPILISECTYWLEQEQTDKLFEGVEPYSKPCIGLDIGDNQSERIKRYYERKRGNS
ncbi:MAG: hypothetical protein ACM3KR_01080 [Deltaproteobacteria bacterium]